MEVACSKCGARGRVPDEQLAAGVLTVRCAACQNVVRVAPPARSEPSAPPRSARVDAWYMDAGQGAQGPYRIDELVALWRSDKISWNAKLWREGDPEWSPARGHGAFIDAIFTHDERARAGAGAGAALGAERPAPAVPSLPTASAGAAGREQTTPSFAAHALGDASIPSAPHDERTPHDSLAPFERASHAPTPRWPLAIVLASGAIAGAVVLWAVLAPPPAEQATTSAAVVAPYEPRALATPAPAVADEGMAAVEPTAVPAADEARRPAALDPTPVRVPAPVTPVGTAPGRSSGRGAATTPASSAPSTRSTDEDERLQQEHAAAEDIAGDDGVSAGGTAADDDDGPEGVAAPAPARTRAPDFLTPAQPLPDLPTTREIASTVRSVAPAVRACAGAIGPTTVYVSVAITGATGRVARVQVPSVSTELQRCIADAVRTAAFPHFERAELELRFPFLIGG